MTLHLTGPALRFFETSRSLQPARQVNGISTKGAESYSPGSRSAPWGEGYRNARFAPKGLHHGKEVDVLMPQSLAQIYLHVVFQQRSVVRFFKTRPCATKCTTTSEASATTSAARFSVSAELRIMFICFAVSVARLQLPTWFRNSSVSHQNG
jgi:hypothetical protein